MKGRTVGGLTCRYGDVWLVGGCRTGFADYNGTLRGISPTDLGIAVARSALDRTALAPGAVDAVIASNLAQASFDAYYLPRHVGLYAGVPETVPALHTHRLCGSGFEVLVQAADAITLDKVGTALCVGAESMSRNPIASYRHRGGIRLGERPDFGDFLFEALTDTAVNAGMGDTAENLAQAYQITRSETDAYAARSFARAVAARDAGVHAEEIVPLEPAAFEANGFEPRKLKLPRGVDRFDRDDHVRETNVETLSALQPAFGGVQTAGNSSAIVDGAAAMIVAGGTAVAQDNLKPVARLVAAATVGVDPRIMGIGPAPAIRALLETAGLTLDQIDRFEVNEAFGAQILAVVKELGLDMDRLNVNGGAIAIGHPLAATGLRCTLTLAHELRRSGGRYGIGSACIGGGQGIALLIENTQPGEQT